MRCPIIRENVLESCPSPALLKCCKNSSIFKEILQTLFIYRPTSISQKALLCVFWVFLEANYLSIVVVLISYIFSFTVILKFHQKLTINLTDCWPLTFSCHLVTTISKGNERNYVLQNWGVHPESSGFVK